MNPSTEYSISNSNSNAQTIDSAESEANRVALAYRQRIGLICISTAAPSVDALRSSFAPQGVLLRSRFGRDRDDAGAGNAAGTLREESRSEAFLTQSEGHSEKKKSAAATLGTDPLTLSIRSMAPRSPVRSPSKQYELYESRRFRQLYERDKQLRQLLLKDQLWDRQTVEQTFRATFMDKRSPSSSP
jgi:hypothetical protein